MTKRIRKPYAHWVENSREMLSIIKFRDWLTQRECILLKDIITSSCPILKCKNGAYFRYSMGLFSEWYFRFNNIASYIKNIEKISTLFAQVIKQKEIMFTKILVTAVEGAGIAHFLDDEFFKKEKEREKKKIFGIFKRKRRNCRIIYQDTNDHAVPIEKLINHRDLYPSDRVIIIQEFLTDFRILERMIDVLKLRRGIKPVGVLLFAAVKSVIPQLEELNKTIPVILMTEVDIELKKRTDLPGDVNKKYFIDDWQT